MWKKNDVNPFQLREHKFISSSGVSTKGPVTSQQDKHQIISVNTTGYHLDTPEDEIPCEQLDEISIGDGVDLSEVESSYISVTSSNGTRWTSPKPLSVFRSGTKPQRKSVILPGSADAKSINEEIECSKTNDFKSKHCIDETRGSHIGDISSNITGHSSLIPFTLKRFVNTQHKKTGTGQRSGSTGTGSRNNSSGSSLWGDSSTANPCLTQNVLPTKSNEINTFCGPFTEQSNNSLPSQPNVSLLQKWLFDGFLYSCVQTTTQLMICGVIMIISFGILLAGIAGGPLQCYSWKWFDRDHIHSGDTDDPSWIQLEDDHTIPNTVKYSNLLWNCVGAVVVQMMNVIILRIMYSPEIITNKLIKLNIGITCVDLIYRLVVFLNNKHDKWWRLMPLNFIYIILLAYNVHKITKYQKSVKIEVSLRTCSSPQISINKKSKILSEGTRLFICFILPAFAVLLFRYTILRWFENGTPNQKILISTAVPLLFSFLFIIGRNTAMGLCGNNIGTSYYCLATLVAFTSGMQRVLQVGLYTLSSKITTGIVIGIFEIISRRSVMWRPAVFQLLKTRKKLDYSFFSNKRRRRILTDLVIFTTFTEFWAIMMAETYSFIVSITYGQLDYRDNFVRFIVHTSAQLLIEIVVDIISYKYEVTEQHMKVFNVWKSSSKGFIYLFCLIQIASLLSMTESVIPLYVNVQNITMYQLEDYCFDTNHTIL
ncbi:MAG: hypothetical protein JKX76_02035 [Colwellia sp.]|nr:hypothetical protein [Colwellia sp.]